MLSSGSLEAMNHLGGVGWEMWCVCGRVSKLAGKRLTDSALPEAPSAQEHRELLAGRGGAALSESPPGLSLFALLFPLCCTFTAAPQSELYITWSSCDSFQGVRSLQALQAPSPSMRGTMKMYTAPWGQLSKVPSAGQ